jgi:hypothetical protein
MRGDFGRDLYAIFMSASILSLQAPLFVEMVCVTASIFSMLSVSFDRYIAVVHPVSHILTFNRAKGQ